jgi:hypothetical protein
MMHALEKKTVALGIRMRRELFDVFMAGDLK